MLETHLATLPADPNALLFTAPGGGNGRDGGATAGRSVTACSSAASSSPPSSAVPSNRRSPRSADAPLNPPGPPSPAAVPPDKANLRWHDLRDTCASLLIHNGASILLVSKRLGHPRPTTTMDRYGWLYPSAEIALTDALDATYDGANVTLSTAERRLRIDLKPRINQGSPPSSYIQSPGSDQSLASSMS